MASNLQVSLWLRLHGQDAAAAGLRRFTDSTRKGFGQVSASVKQAWQDLNGFSAASRLFAFAGGVALLKNALDANLEFEKKILEMKQLADMTQEQAAQMRKLAIDKSREALATPMEIAEGLRTLANAGMKYELIAPTIQEAARAAAVFRSTIQEIANMDFDIEQKFKVDPKDLAAVHEMLYYHSKQGRFEAASLSRYAPVYLNEMQRMGMGGVTGLNFAGAMTQVMQQIAPATNPEEVATLIRHGLGHITQTHYVAGLKKAGIDVQQFAPGGKFTGEGGVQGLLDLARAMQKAGLEDPYKMSQAGFREEYTRNFWLQLMKNADEIERQMQGGQGAYRSGQIDKDKAEMQKSGFGRAKALQIEAEKGKLGETATTGVDFTTRMMEDIADHKGQYLGAAAAGAGLLWMRRMNRNRQAGAAAEKAAAAAGAGIGVQQVFVTNWPVAMGGTGVGSGGPPGGMGPNAGPQRPQSKLSRAMGAAGKAIGVAGAAVSGWEIGHELIGPALNSAINALTAAMTRKDQTLGEALYEALHRRELEALNKPIVIENKMVLDGAQIAETINRVNARYGGRN